MRMQAVLLLLFFRHNCKASCDFSCGCVLNDCCARYSSPLCQVPAPPYDYKGSKNTTVDGAPCDRWRTGTQKQMGEHNFCRITAHGMANMEKQPRLRGPWCYSGGVAKNCFPDCNEIGDSCASRTTTLRSSIVLGTEAPLSCDGHEEIVAWACAGTAMSVTFLLFMVNCIYCLVRQRRNQSFLLCPDVEAEKEERLRRERDPRQIWKRQQKLQKRLKKTGDKSVIPEPTEAHRQKEQKRWRKAERRHQRAQQRMQSRRLTPPPLTIAGDKTVTPKEVSQRFAEMRLQTVDVKREDRWKPTQNKEVQQLVYSIGLEKSHELNRVRAVMEVAEGAEEHSEVN